MNGFRFTLSGQVACFRRPDVNVRVYFTYNNIHKVALLGLLGAVLGLKGYRDNKLFKEPLGEFPEFYSVLSQLLVSVSPKGNNGYFSKKIQYFNNSVGYASKEQGGNLQVREQWLEKPEWDILLIKNKLSDEIWDKLCDFLFNGQCVYLPYLGKNDFPAVITNAGVQELSPVQSNKVDSLFLCDSDLKKLTEGDGRYIFVETAPIALAPNYNFYEFGRYVFTDYSLTKEMLPQHLYTDGEKNYSFY